MGTRNPENCSFSDFAQGVEHVEHMIRQKWAVRAYCRKCDLHMTVDLFLISRVAGPRTVLWDRTVRCRRWRCNGRAVFQACPHPRLKTWSDMISAHRVGFLGVRPERLENGRPVAPLD